MATDDQYQKTLDYLYSFVDFSLTKGMRYSPEQFDLGRMYAFVRALGHPEEAYPCIHVAGTKGKGSVSSMCTAALIAGGYRVGLYTSPHLHDYAERIQIDRQPIPHEELTALVDELRPVIESIPKLTTFEITTALAFLYFQRRKVQAAVLEVGLGGRLDATNVVNPTITVITSLSYDHTQILGETLAEIAGEKAGIIKQSVPVVMSPQKEEARQVIIKIAAERSAPLIEVGKDYHFAPLEHSLEGQSLRVWLDNDHSSGENLDIPLLGAHQVENAATAYAALQVFSERALQVTDEMIQQGFAIASWPGRFEVLRRNPPVVVDSAHNRDSASRLKQALDDYFPGLPVVMVFGASEDKDIAGMFAELNPLVQEVVATKSFHPRAIAAERIREIASQFGKPVKIVEDIPEAVEEALRLAGETRLVLVTGSIFVVAATREAWLARLANTGG
jgi:dihydrofolate synthase/folylpolyglutamate synthase